MRTEEKVERMMLSILDVEAILEDIEMDGSQNIMSEWKKCLIWVLETEE